jgi:hypothetical protein
MQKKRVWLTAPPPTITSLSSKSALAGTQVTLQTNGATLLGASFAFQPPTSPPIAVQVNSIDPSGSSASLTLNIPATAIGTFALVATSPTGSSTSAIAPQARAIHIKPGWPTTPPSASSRRTLAAAGGEPC